MQSVINVDSTKDTNNCYSIMNTEAMKAESI